MAGSLVLLTKQAKALDDPLPCQRENPQLWFSERPADLALAKAHCQPCPLRRFCLDGAVERREPYGVWGGEIFTNGAIIAEKRPRGRPPRRLSALWPPPMTWHPRTPELRPEASRPACSPPLSSAASQGAGPRLASRAAGAGCSSKKRMNSAPASGPRGSV